MDNTVELNLELKESITNQQRIFIRDYLNGMYKEEELMAKFDLVKCENATCDNVELEEEVNEFGLCQQCEGGV